MKREELESFSLFSLRQLGRKIGVKGSSALTKKMLIDEIVSIESGNKKPHFTNKGRPVKTSNTSNLQKELREEIEQIENLKFKNKEKELVLLNLIEMKRKIEHLFNEVIKEITEKGIEE